MQGLTQIGGCKLRNLAFCFVHILFACLFFGLIGNYIEVVSQASVMKSGRGSKGPFLFIT